MLGGVAGKRGWTNAVLDSTSSHRRGLSDSFDHRKRLQRVIYLEPAELVFLTGYKRSADQVRWLERNGIPFILNRLGRPVVRKDMETATESAPELGPVR